MIESPEPEWLTPEQVAARLPRGNADWVRQQLRTGRLRGSKIGGFWFVEPAAVRGDDRGRQQLERTVGIEPETPKAGMTPLAPLLGTGVGMTDDSEYEYLTTAEVGAEIRRSPMPRRAS